MKDSNENGISPVRQSTRTPVPEAFVADWMKELLMSRHGFETGLASPSAFATQEVKGVFALLSSETQEISTGPGMTGSGGPSHSP
jgi:hypothetical protein